jgi:hypothetical protein
VVAIFFAAILRNGFRRLVSTQDAGRQEAAGSGNGGSMLLITHFYFILLYACGFLYECFCIITLVFWFESYHLLD